MKEITVLSSTIHLLKHLAFELVCAEDDAGTNY
jgi:hypothetical protein